MEAVRPPTTIERVRAYLNTHGYRSIRNIAMMFKKVNTDNMGSDRSLSFNELETALTEFGLELSRNEMETVYSSYDRNSDGSISLDELITSLRPPMNPSRRALVERAFDKIDRNRDNQITIEDISGVYDVTKHPKYKSGDWSKKDILKEFLDTFQVSGNRDEKVTRQEFIDYYAMLSANIDRDVYFDFMVRNSWKL